MKAFLTSISHTPFSMDITSVYDSYKNEVLVGYRIGFTIQTARFRLEGEVEVHEHPLTPEQIQQKLITALEEDFLSASAEGIQGIY